MTKLKNIVYEQGDYWVYKKNHGHYEVFRNGITHATRCAIIHFSSDDKKALDNAIKECQRRNNIENDTRN